MKGQKDKEKIGKLADLFSPPIELLCAENFDMVIELSLFFKFSPYSRIYKQAKVFSVDSKRWLLVNIQDVAEFASQRLNRDTWKDSQVQSLIKSSFVFWQVRHFDQLHNVLMKYNRKTERIQMQQSTFSFIQ